MNYGLGNKITPYKSRIIEFDSNVHVYRCLTRKGKVYSIRQKGKVVAHTTCLMISDAEFVVNKAEQEKVRLSKHRTVHAYIKGKIARRGLMGVTAAGGEENSDALLPANIVYNPFKTDTFVIDNLTVQPVPVKGAMAVAINNIGVRASYTY